MKKIRRYLIAFIGIICLFTTLNAKAAYTYSHDNKIISAPAGYSATIDGVYNVLRTAWGGHITEKEFNSPEDLYIYKNEETNEETIYIVSSSNSIDSATKVCYNTLFVFL